MTPAPGRFSTAASWRAWTSLIVGLLLSAVLMIYFEARRGHRKEINKHERERRALVSHFDYLVKYGNDIMILSDQSGNILEANDRAYLAYGYTQTELLGMNVAGLLPRTVNPDIKGHRHGAAACREPAAVDPGRR